MGEIPNIMDSYPYCRRIVGRRVSYRIRQFMDSLKFLGKIAGKTRLWNAFNLSLFLSGKPLDTRCTL
jgi:hypothetical protein